MHISVQYDLSMTYTYTLIHLQYAIHNMQLRSQPDAKPVTIQCSYLASFNPTTTRDILIGRIMYARSDHAEQHNQSRHFRPHHTHRDRKPPRNSYSIYPTATVQSAGLLRFTNKLS